MSSCTFPFPTAPSTDRSRLEFLPYMIKTVENAFGFEREEEGRCRDSTMLVIRNCVKLPAVFSAVSYSHFLN